MPSDPTTSLDLTAPEVVADPYPFFAEERAAHRWPGTSPPGMLLTFDHATVGAVQRDRRLGRLWRDKEPADYLEPFNLLHRNQMMENEPPGAHAAAAAGGGGVRPRTRGAAAAAGSGAGGALLDEAGPRRLRRDRRTTPSRCRCW